MYKYIMLHVNMLLNKLCLCLRCYSTGNPLYRDIIIDPHGGGPTLATLKSAMHVYAHLCGMTKFTLM